MRVNFNGKKKVYKKEDNKKKEKHVNLVDSEKEQL